jgi:hypothetical protein
MKIKKLAIVISLLSFYGISHAEYIMKFNLEHGSIIMKAPVDNPEPTEPPEIPDDKPLAEISSAVAPDAVFFNYPFNVELSSINTVKYKIASANASAGVPVSGVEFEKVSTYMITPTQPGTYVYAITAINEDGIESSSKDISVTVEDYPTVNSVKINNAVDFLQTDKGIALNVTTDVSDGATVIQNVPANASVDPGEATYKFYAEKSLNGITKKSTEKSFIVGTGNMFTMRVGKYINGSTEVVGFINNSSQNSGYTVQTAGSISTNNIKQNTVYHIYQAATGGSLRFVFNPNSPDGFFVGGKIWVDNALCGQTTASYTSTIDTYLFAGCPLRLANNFGKDVKIYY